MTYGIKLKVWGDYALFTRPEMKAERVTYDIITPSAARGILEAVYWKPEIRWVVHRIHVLNPIRFASIRRNELGSVIPAGTVRSAMQSGTGTLGVYVEEVRQQRAATVLRDVAYVIEARFDVLDASGPETKPEAKHLDQFRRRARAGQCFHRPYLGCREFACDFELVEGEPERSRLAGTPEGNRDLGYMLHDISFDRGMTAFFYRAVMRDGVVDVPPPTSHEVRA